MAQFWKKKKGKIFLSPFLGKLSPGPLEKEKKKTKINMIWKKKNFSLELFGGCIFFFMFFEKNSPPENPAKRTIKIFLGGWDPNLTSP